MAEPFDLPPAADEGNPFAPPRSTRTMPARGGVTDVTLPGPMAGSLVGHVVPVAILMIIQGALELVMGIVWLSLVVVVPALIADMPGGKGVPPPATLQTMLTVVYGVMAAGGMIAGPLHVAAGISGLRYRRRKLGMVALIAGLASASTIYCAPTAIGLAIYGMITYCNPTVVAAFALGDAGVPPADIRARFRA